jgi:hypothetical protein
MDLVEHQNVGRVEIHMNRARAILVSLIPVVLLLAATDCLSDPIAGSGYDHLSSWLSADGHGKHDSSPGDNSFDQPVHRWNRRNNVQPGEDRFASPATFTQSQFASRGQSVDFVDNPCVNLELAQGWQFHWRTALEPRSPSLAS